MVPLVLTLATPHQRPPGPPQSSLAAFYRRLAAARVPAVPIVSIAGGRHDVQVRLCPLTLRKHGMAENLISEGW
jgi:hypothetical protein